MSEVMEDSTEAQVDLPLAEEIAELPKFEFDAAFQGKIAALIVRDTQFVQRVDGLIRPEYFESGVDAAWVSLVIRYYQKYKKIPADRTIYAKLLKEDLSARIFDPVMMSAMARYYQDVILKADISDREYVVDQVATFARHQAVSAAILQSVVDLDRHDFDKISKSLRNALDVGANQDGDIYNFGEQVEARAGERLDRAAGTLPPTGITTGHATLDNCLYHKGWGRRELSVIMGGAKAGKSSFLIDQAIQAVHAKHNVLYITLEVAAKILAERCDANISETNIADLQSHIHDVKSKVKTFMTTSGAQLVIKEFPTGSATVSDIRRLIERFKSRGIVFDLVIIDYADIMAPERFTDNLQENSKSVYVGIRGLAMAEGFAVLTATQTNREGFKATVAKAEHVAEDFNRIRICDIIISINRTPEELAAGTARLFFVACRNQAAGFTLRIEQNLGQMRFITKVVGFE